jgi:hypothetical protein
MIREPSAAEPPGDPPLPAIVEDQTVSPAAASQPEDRLANAVGPQPLQDRSVLGIFAEAEPAQPGRAVSSQDQLVEEIRQRLALDRGILGFLAAPDGRLFPTAGEVILTLLVIAIAGLISLPAMTVSFEILSRSRFTAPKITFPLLFAQAWLIMNLGLPLALVSLNWRRRMLSPPVNFRELARDYRQVQVSMTVISLLGLMLVSWAILVIRFSVSSARFW